MSSFFKSLFIYFWPHWAFVAPGRLSLVAAHWLLIVVTSLVVERRFQVSGCGSRVRAQELGCIDPATQQHVGPSWTKDLTFVSCSGRQILNHWTTREVQGIVSSQMWSSHRVFYCILSLRQWKLFFLMPIFLSCFNSFLCAHSVMSDFLQPHELQPTRLLCPWNFPGNNTGVDYHFLLQGIFPTQGSNSCLFCLLHWQIKSLLCGLFIWSYIFFFSIFVHFLVI